MSGVITTSFLEEMFQAIDDSQWNRLRECFHERIVYERPGYEPFEGQDRVLKFYREERIIASGRHHTEGIVIDGNKGAAWGRFTGQHKNGADLDELYADVYRFEDSLIITRRSHFYRKGV